MLAAIAAVILGVVARKPTPGLNQLVVILDTEVQTFDIEFSGYNVHQEGDAWFLTVSCAASRDSNSSPDSCHLEFSIPFEANPEAKLTRNATFQIPGYHEKHLNLTYFYYLGYGDFDDGVFKIKRLKGPDIEATLVFDGGSVLVRALFKRNEGISRSFD